MLRIPELNRNSFFSKVYQPNLVQTLKSTDYDFYQLNTRPGSLKVLSGLSLTNFQEKQDAYRQTVADFTGSVKAMGTAAKMLQDSNFYNKTYVQSASNAVSGETKTGALSTQYSVNVTQVATTQRNEGASLSKGSIGALNSGSYTFGVTVGAASEKQLTVNIGATDTNEQILQKFAKAINDSDSGVDASIKTAGEKGFLALQGEKTGQMNGFSLRDITGNGVASLQLNNIVRASGDAKYNIDGQNYQASDNMVKLDGGKVILQLQKETTGAVKVSIGKDAEQVVNAVKNLVTQYNKVNAIMQDNDQVSMRGTKLLSGIQTLADRTRRSDLAAIGITADKSTGDLTVDANTLKAALTTKPDKVRSVLGGSLARTMATVSETVGAAAPSSYLKPPNPLDSIDYSSSFSRNSWLQQSRQVAQGMFLDVSV